VQLVDPQTRENLWAETYDRGYTRDDIFSIQTGIALSISRMLKAELSTQVEAMMLEASTASLRASEHYWAARRLLASRNIADLKQARAEFEQAIAIDPGYALAWVGKADSLLLLASRGEITPPINGVNEAQQAIDRALALNEQLGEAYVTQGNIVKWKPYSKDREAERAVAYEKAIEFSPGYAPAYFYSGNMLNTYFEHHQAFNFYRKALDLDPASSIVRASMSSVLREIGRPEEALRILRPILRFDPDFASVYTAIGGIHAEQGRLAEAIRWYRQTERLDPDFWLLWMKLSDAFLAMEDYEGLADVRGRLLAQKGPDSILAFRSDFWAIFNRDGWQATLDWLDSLPPAWTDRNLKERVRQVLYVYVVAERYGNAYEHLIRTEPRWVEPEEWHDLIVIQRNGAPDHIPFDLYDSCVPAGVLIDAGEEALGRALINQTIDLLENEIGAVVDDIHRFQTLGVCYLLNGFYDKALEFFEDYVADGHFSDPNWIWVRQLPWWKPVRNDPRFIALLQQVAALQAEQRDLLERMRHNGELDTLPVF
jgi:tetratricopeptide (TPR) repeat protein